MDQPEQHPDDEILAALVDKEPGDGLDAGLRAHLARCSRCSSVLDELSTLHSALAELPDLAPPRPMRLLPPVEEPHRSRLGTVGRRLFGPVLAVGLALGVVGGAGSLSTLGSMMGASGGAAPQREVAQPAAQPSAAGQGRTLDTASDAGASAERPERPAFDAFQSPGAAMPAPITWPLLLVMGLVLVGVALVLRFLIEPRAR